MSGFNNLEVNFQVFSFFFFFSTIAVSHSCMHRCIMRFKGIWFTAFQLNIQVQRDRKSVV